MNAEFKQVQTRRADLLGRTGSGQLVHIELQSTNDEDMPVRMVEYALGIYRQFRKLPIYIVLYVGEAPTWSVRFWNASQYWTKRAAPCLRYFG